MESGKSESRECGGVERPRREEIKAVCVLRAAGEVDYHVSESQDNSSGQIMGSFAPLGDETVSGGLT